MPSSGQMSAGSRRRRLIDRVLTVVLVGMVLAALGIAGYTVSTHYQESPFTEFYIVGPEGKAADYPEVLSVGEQGAVTVGIANHEGAQTDYRIELIIDGSPSARMGPVRLAPDKTWEDGVEFTMDSPGENQQIELALYKDAESDPYLSLHLWVDVREPEQGRSEGDAAGASAGNQ